jgi:hypothetical protein
MADLQKVGLTREQKTALLLNIPMARVIGSVDVENASLDVDIQNTPIEVQIVR